MRVLLSICAIAQLGMAAEGFAQPCVSSTFDTPMPGATNVISTVTDVPSVQFPAFWQQGDIEGFRYRLFSNGEGVIAPATADPSWRIEITCDVADSCSLSPIGSPPAEAITIADIVGQCLIRSDIEASDFKIEPTPTIEPAVAVVVVDEPPIVEPPCGIETVTETNEVAALQRLLVIAGANPGAIDGLLGPNTFQALASYVDDPSWDISVPAAIATVDAAICGPSE